MIERAILNVVLGLIGLCAGSFVTTAALRAARGQPYLTGRSHCDACGEVLGYSATLPLVSYIRLRGSGACCGAKIERVHLAGELAGLGLALICTSLTNPLQGALLAVLGLLLIATSVIDAKSGRLPDRLTLAIAAMATGLSLTRGLSFAISGIVACAIAFGLLEGGSAHLSKDHGKGRPWYG